jgi:AsmA protein
MLVKQVLEKTGYQLTIDGHLSWSFYPRIGIKVDHMLLSVPQQKPFLDLYGVQIGGQALQLLSGVNTLKGVIDIDALNLLHIQAQHVDIKLIWQDQVLSLRSIHAELYNGILIGAASGRTLTTVPQWQWDIDANNFQLKPLLADVNAGSHFTIAGVGHLHFQATTSGTSKTALLNNLVGTSQFSIQNGIVSGLDLNYLIQTADALINHQAAAINLNNISHGHTTFSSLTGTITLSKGIATTDNLALTAPAFLGSGTGNVNLIAHTLNLVLHVKSQQMLHTQWDLPVLISGSLNQPQIRLDTTAIQKALLKQKIDKVKAKILNDVQQHLPQATAFIQHLLGQ